MYITNNPELASIADEAGVDYLFIDMEYIGKSERQKGLDTVQLHHTIKDIQLIKKTLSKAKLLVRVNKIHPATNDYISSEDEIDQAIENGADMLMLPYFKTLEEVSFFLKTVNGRCQTMLLIETPEAVEILDEILKLKGIDSIHIGLNDLSIGYKKSFMFELLADGTVENICSKIQCANIPYGFGGIAKLGYGAIPAEMIIQEHYRLKSSFAILSRSFFNEKDYINYSESRKCFIHELNKIREFESQCLSITNESFEENRKKILYLVNKEKINA